jgi:hypothetical protein
MATLIDVATPGPALAVTDAGAGTPGISGTSVVETTANTVYGLNLVSLTAGTWVVTGVVNVQTGSATQTNYLNLANATGSNSWPVQITTGEVALKISAVIKISGTTSVYLNGKNTASTITTVSLITATQIA